MTDRNLADARKENAYLLSRLAKLNAATRALLAIPMPADDKDPNYNRLIDRRLALRAILNEMPPRST